MRRHAPYILGLAVVGVIFFFAPALAYLGGTRPKPFENRPLAAFPSFSRGFDVFDALNQWSIDHLPLRADAVRFRANVYRDVFDQLPPQTLAAGPVGIGATGTLGGLAAKANQGLPRTAQVIAGKDGWLFYGQEFVNACRPAASIPTVIAGLRRLSDIIRRSGRKVVILIPPDKSGMSPGQLPADLPERACTAHAHAARLAALRAAHIPGWIDLDARLKRRQAQLGHPIYLPRDTHWSQEGALVYAKTLVGALGPGLWESAKVVPIGKVPYVGDTAKLIGDASKALEPGFRVDRPGVPGPSPRRSIPAIPPNWAFTQSAVAGAGGSVVGPSTVVYGDSFDLDAADKTFPFFRRITHMQDLTAGYLSSVQPEARAKAVDEIATGSTVVIEQIERTVWGLSFGAVWAPEFLSELQRRLAAGGRPPPSSGGNPAPAAGAPARVVATTGFAPLERLNSATWRWAVHPTASLRLAGTGRASRHVFSALLTTTPGRAVMVTIVFPDGGRRAYRVTGRESPLSRTFTLPAAGGVIRFSTTAGPSKAPPDPRALYFKVLDAKVTAAG